jgi:hypothetical protein
MGRWDALRETCLREDIDTGEPVRQIDASSHRGGRTSAVRVCMLQYDRAAAIAQGHMSAGHGRATPAMRPAAQTGHPLGLSCRHLRRCRSVHGQRHKRADISISQHITMSLW